jgi:hypothetical protein
MSQLLRLLLLTPAAFSSILSLILVSPAHAVDKTWVQVSEKTTCLRVRSLQAVQFTCKRWEGKGFNPARVVDLTKPDPQAAKLDRGVDSFENPDATTFEMTDEESRTAIALFGCDCAGCTRSLRKLRSLVS